MRKSDIHKRVWPWWHLLPWLGLCLLGACNDAPVAPTTRPIAPPAQAAYDSLYIDSLFRLARAQFDSADHAAALQSLRKAEMNLPAPGVKGAQIRAQKVSYLKGTVQAQLGLIPAALQTFRQSLAQAKGDGFGDSLRHAYQGRACNALANRFSQLGMLDSAALYANAALEHLQASEQPDPMNLSIGLTTLGVIAQGQAGQAEDSAYYFQKADSCFQAVLAIRKGLAVVPPRKLGNAYLNIGDLHRAWGHLDLARPALKQAVACYSLAGGAALDAMAVTVATQAQCAEQEGDASSAAEGYARAAALCQRAFRGPHRETGKILVLEGNFWLQQGDPRRALGCFQGALQQFLPAFTDAAHHRNPERWMIGQEWYVTSALLGKAAAYDRFPTHRDSAYACYLDAFKFADGLRRNYGSLDEKSALADYVYPAYEQAITAAILHYQQSGDRRHLGLAFEFMERSKANELLDALDQVAVTHEYALPDSIWLRGRELAVRSDDLRRRLADGEHLAADSLLVLQDDSLKLQAWVKAHYPGLFFADDSYRPWDEVVSQLKGEDTLLLEYFLGTRQLCILAACGGRDTAITVPWDSSLQAAVKELHAALNLQRPTPLNPCFTDPAWLLYREIVLPALPLCRRPGRIPKRMIVIPDGHLAFIPFEALLTAPAGQEKNAKRLPYLLLSTVVSYTQSVQVLLHETAPAKPPVHPGVLGLGSDRQFENLRGDLQPLKHATREVRKAVELMGGRAIVNEAATEGIFKSLAPQYEQVHVATHGRLDVEAPLRSSLYFHSDQATHDDGELHAYEIYGMRLPAGLAVLSACSVGDGRVVKGQGVMSLGRSFMVAGCANVVMTLQDVSDQKASEIMDQFYQALASGNTIAEALQIGRIQYLQNTDAEYAHPAYWSPFILVGKGDGSLQTLQGTPRLAWQLVLAAALLAAAGCGWWWWRRKGNRHHLPEVRGLQAGN